MKKKILKIVNLIIVVGVMVVSAGPIVEESIVAEATNIDSLQNQIDQHQNELDNITSQIDALTDEQDLIEEMIADLNAEIINTMTSVGMKEDEIAAKEAELADKQTELIDKQVQIVETQAAYEEAKAREEKQYADMLVRMRAMYENGTSTYLGHFLKGKGLGDMLNRMDYIEKIYEYDRMKLEEYEATKDEVHNLWEQLEVEKVQLENERAGLEADKVQLEAERASLEDQKKELDGMLARKQQESANYESEINRYKQEAAVAKQLLQQERQQLQQLQAQQNQGNTSAATGSYTESSYTSTIENASGSDMGKRLAKYACQYIGNPYVYGGTSLTNGADCSGFVYRVYKDFGYQLPRTSYEQRSAGTGVSYSEAQPGDLICYDGHIGIYIGGGKIVHASTERTGIKVSNATYRTILSVRRIL